jgi:hypothetical protein
MTEVQIEAERIFGTPVKPSGLYTEQCVGLGHRVLVQGDEKTPERFGLGLGPGFDKEGLAGHEIRMIQSQTPHRNPARPVFA